jgi:hypothetical protein
MIGAVWFMIAMKEVARWSCLTHNKIEIKADETNLISLSSAFAERQGLADTDPVVGGLQLNTCLFGDAHFHFCIRRSRTL